MFRSEAVLYISVDDLKRWLRIPGNYEGSINTEEDVSDDLDLAIAIGAASRLIDVSCNTTFDDPIPDAVKLACTIQAARFFKRRDAAFGVAGSPELGNELRLLAKLDPDVALLVSAHKVWWGAV